MPPDAYLQTKSALLALGGHRVWSLMATLFGDLAQAEGTKIDGPVLSAIMAEMDIRPEAVRVALYRLRNDGWIMSEKHGRTGRHSLTPTSRAETRAASARIYADPRKTVNGWTLALTQDTATTQQMIQSGFVALLPRVFVGTPQATAPASALVLRGTPAPDWLRTQLASALLAEDYARLLPPLQTAHDQLRGHHLAPLQTAVIRCLVVHNWRRIVLRHPALPVDLLPSDWAGHSCHLLVDSLLAALPRPDLDDITRL
jgi:phenylacetic acid degradation operon negative regulatory protein